MLIFSYISAFKVKTFKGDYMVYKIRLRAREKQAECSAIIFLSFFILFLTILCLNLLPLVYLSLKSFIGENPVADVVASVFLSGLLIVIYSSLSMGTDRFMLKRSQNIIAGAGDIFYYFAPKNLLAMCSFLFILGVRKLLILLFLSIPAIICALVFYTLSDSGFSAIVCSIFAAFTAIFIIVSLIAYRHITDTFFLTRYMFIKGEYLNFRHLFAVSQSEMIPHIKRLRQLRISFSGWFLLSLLILPLPYVWGYYRQSKAYFAAEIIKS